LKENSKSLNLISKSEKLSNETSEYLPVLLIEMIASMESDIKDLDFTWNCTRQNKTKMEIELYFKNPLRISANVVSILLFDLIRYLTKSE
jgi:hypothetical protein